MSLLLIKKGESMFDLNVLLAQIRQFEEVTCIRIFQKDGIYDLGGIKNITLLSDDFRGLVHAIYLNLIMYVRGRDISFVQEHADEMENHGYSVRTEGEGSDLVCFLKTSVGDLKF